MGGRHFVIWWAQSALPGWDRVYYSAKIWGSHGLSGPSGSDRTLYLYLVFTSTSVLYYIKLDLLDMFQSNGFNQLHLTFFIMVFRCIKMGIFINIKGKTITIETSNSHTLGIETYCGRVASRSTTDCKEVGKNFGFTCRIQAKRWCSI
mgnify:CR=1 FL=1